MTIKLTDLLPLREAKLHPDEILDPYENLKIYLNYVLIDQTGKKEKFKIDIKKVSDSEYEATLNNRITIKAFPLFYKDENGEKYIGGWKFKYENWSETVKTNIWSHGIGHFDPHFFGMISMLAQGINDEPRKISDGSDIHLNAEDVKKYLNKIKNIIDNHKWYYDLSDAHNTYSEGSKQIEAIKELYKELPKAAREEVFKYWNSKSPSSIFNYAKFEDFNRRFGR